MKPAETADLMKINGAVGVALDLARDRALTGTSIARVTHEEDGSVSIERIDPRVTAEADAERRRLAGLPERNSRHPNPDKPTPEEWGQSAPAPLEALPKPPARAQKALQWLRGGNVVLQQGPRK